MVVGHLPDTKRPHHQQAHLGHQGHGRRKQGPQQIDAIVDGQIVSVRLAKTCSLAFLLGKGLHHADPGYGVRQHIGQLRPDAVDFFKTRAQPITHLMYQPGNERQRQQGGQSQAGIDGEENDGGHQDHQHVGGEVQQVHGQEQAQAVCLGADACHEVACATPAEILQRQLHQVLIGGGAQVCANALRHQRQDVGFEPPQSPGQQGSHKQPPQVHRHHLVFDLLAVLKRDQHLVHQRHGHVGRDQGCCRGGQGQQETRQQLFFIGLGETPQTKQAPGRGRSVDLTGTNGTRIARIFQGQLALGTTRRFKFDHGLATSQQRLAGIPDLLQAHGQHIVAKRETPLGQPLLLVDQSQMPYSCMVMVGQGSA